MLNSVWISGKQNFFKNRCTDCRKTVAVCVWIASLVVNFPGIVTAGQTPLEVLDRNDLVYEVLPPRWVLGLPVGNGILGGMVWIEDQTRLIVTLDHVRAWDYRQSPRKLTDDKLNYQYIYQERLANNRDVQGLTMPDDFTWLLPTKTYVGRLVIEFDRPIEGTARLVLKSAEAMITIQGTNGDSTKIGVVALANYPAIMVDHDGVQGIEEIRIERIPSARLGGGWHRPEEIPDWYRYPDSQRGEDDNVSWIRQEVPESPAIALALVTGPRRSFVTVEVDGAEDDPVAAAITVAREANSRWSELLVDHQVWWQQFWGRSNVQLPNAQLENLWYMGLYLLASSSREGGAAVSLHGLWPPDSRIPLQLGLYIWDFYPQYWGIYAANHLELGTAYYDHMHAIMPRLQEDTRRFFGWDGVYVPGSMVHDGSAIWSWQHVLYWPGTSAWVSQAFWWHYLYSNDEDFLREQAYPFMRESMLFYEGYLTREDDGLYHVSPDFSPEHGGWGRDGTLSLSMIRGLVAGLLASVEILEIDEPHLDRWRDIAEHLPDYNQDEQTGLFLKEGDPYKFFHYHLSHLGPIYPGGDLNLDGSDADVKLIETSMNNHAKYGHPDWVGWSFVWNSIICSRAGRPERARWSLQQFADACVSCNTFNLNGDWKDTGLSSVNHAVTYCQDGNMAAVSAINEMLLQSWGGRIRLFPACPADWRDVAFDRLLAEGNVEVSSARANGETQWVKLLSPRDQQVRVQNPFGPDGGFLNGQAIRGNDDGDLVLQLAAGQVVTLMASPLGTGEQSPRIGVARSEEDNNPYGLKFLHPVLFSPAFDCFEDNH